MSRASNYPPGVTGHEPHLTGDDPTDRPEVEMFGDWFVCVRCDWHATSPGACPECDEPLVAEDDVPTCPNCDSPYHADCTDGMTPRRNLR